MSSMSPAAKATATAGIFASALPNFTRLETSEGWLWVRRANQAAGDREPSVVQVFSDSHAASSEASRASTWLRRRAHATTASSFSDNKYDESDLAASVTIGFRCGLRSGPFSIGCSSRSTRPRICEGGPLDRPQLQLDIDSSAPLPVERAYTFEAALWEHDGDGACHFISLPDAVADEIDELHGHRAGGFGSVRVEVTIGASTWRTSVFPDKKRSTYLLPVKKPVRRAEDLEAGSVVRVSLEVVD